MLFVVALYMPSFLMLRYLFVSFVAVVASSTGPVLTEQDLLFKDIYQFHRISRQEIYDITESVPEGEKPLAGYLSMLSVLLNESTEMIHHLVVDDDSDEAVSNAEMIACVGFLHKWLKAFLGPINNLQTRPGLESHADVSAFVKRQKMGWHRLAVRCGLLQARITSEGTSIEAESTAAPTVFEVPKSTVPMEVEATTTIPPVEAASQITATTATPQEVVSTTSLNVWQRRIAAREARLAELTAATLDEKDWTVVKKKGRKTTM